MIIFAQLNVGIQMVKCWYTDKTDRKPSLHFKDSTKKICSVFVLQNSNQSYTKDT